MKGGLTRRMVTGWIVTLVGLALATAGLLPFRSASTTAVSALVLLVPVTVGVAVGGVSAVPIGVVAGFLTLSVVFLPPYNRFTVTHWADGVALLVYAVVGCTVGLVVARFERAHLQAEARRREVAVLLDEQAALRRVATLVAHGVPPDAVFAAVTSEVSGLLGADAAVLLTYEPDGTACVVAGHTEQAVEVEVGARLPLAGENVAGMVLRSGQPARMDDYAQANGEFAAQTVAQGVQAGVGSPIVVEGRVWGAVIAFTTTGFPPVIEHRLAQFTELAGTAIANADSRAELTASRARVVAAADDARRRIERDLHDGAQQRLVSLALETQMARADLPPDAGELAARLDGLAEGLVEALDELRELAQGIHPVVLARGGLPDALDALTHRSAVPVQLDVRVGGRLPEHIELAVYYVISEALTNVGKHARASVARVDVQADTDAVHLTIADDGVGGADLRGGSGIVGLKDRIEALGGRMELTSPAGGGTTLSAAVPIGLDLSRAGRGSGVDSRPSGGHQGVSH